jgi:hypothetical protein
MYIYILSKNVNNMSSTSLSGNAQLISSVAAPGAKTNHVQADPCILRGIFDCCEVWHSGSGPHLPRSKCVRCGFFQTETVC